MSDLQCPVRIVLLREPATAAVADVLAAERVVATYDAPVDLEELADLHRGEAVAVVGPHDFGAGPVIVVEVDADGARPVGISSSPEQP